MGGLHHPKLIRSLHLSRILRIRSVYVQQQQFFNKTQREGCPRNLFLLDLAQAIQSWHTAGDSIVLFADMNDDICHPQIIEFIEHCNLHKLLLSRKPGVPTPATFQHGSRHSKCPIDGAWATPNMIISQSLYCTVANSPGNHQAIIIDINLLATIGEPHFTIIHPPG